MTNKRRPKSGALPTSGGVPITEKLIDELASEAERGYEPAKLRKRGRPSLGTGPSEIVPVRLDPELRRALGDRAADEETTQSDLVRRALRTFLGTKQDRQGDDSAEDATAEAVKWDAPAASDSPLSKQPRSSSIETAYALNAMTDDKRFELMASQLLARCVDPRIRPLGGTADRGRDAVRGLYRFGHGEELICGFSLRDGWDDKIREDLAHIEREGWSAREVIAVTSRKTTNQRENKLQELAGETGRHLTIYGQKQLTHWLELPMNLDLREEYLGLARPRLPFFLTADEFAGQLARAGAVLDAPFVGRQADVVAILDALQSGARLLLIDGDGGLGKSRLALESSATERAGTPWFFVPAGQPFESDMISELGAGSEVVVVLDDAHRRTDLRAVVDALSRRNPSASVVLLARPGFREKIGSDLDGLSATPPKPFELAALRRGEIVAVLKAPPFSLEREGLVALVVQLAEGNPQLAAIAGSLAAKGEKLDTLSRDELFRTYARSAVRTAAGPSSEREELLAIIAAVRSINPDDERVAGAIEALTGLSAVGLRREIHSLADRGPVVERGGIYMIKPDLLSEQILRHSFFDMSRSPVIDYGRLYRAFAPLERPTLLEALGAAGVDEEAAERLEIVRRDVLGRIDEVGAAGAATYGRFVRALAPGLPMLALEIFDALVERLPALDDEAADEVVGELVGALARIRYIDLAWQRLMQLGGLIFTRPENRAHKRWVEAVTTVYERLPIDTYGDEGRTLVIIQQSIREQSKNHWQSSDRGYAAAKTASYAARALMTLVFETHRASAEDSNRILLRANAMPASQFTRDALVEGARLFRESFATLSPREQIEQLGALADVAHVACGFEQSFGLRPGEDLQALAREVLAGEIEPWLACELEGFAAPVAADALDHFSWRARHDETVEIPVASEGLQEYYDLIHPTHHRELGEGYEGMVAGEAEIGRAYVPKLVDDADPTCVLDRWRDWLAEAEAAKDKTPWHGSLQALFDEVGKADRNLVAQLAEHLRTHGGLLTRYASGLIKSWLGEATDEEIERWVESEDVQARAALPWAMSGRGDPAERLVFERLARDESSVVRARLWQQLFAARDKATWRTQLLIELTDLGRPDHLAAIAREATEGGREIDPQAAALVRERVLASAEADNVSEHAVRDALRQLRALGIDLTFEWIVRRLEWVGHAERLFSYRDVPDGVIALLSQRREGEQWREELAHFVELYERPNSSYGFRSAMARSIAALGGDSKELTDLIRQWADGGEEQLERAYDVIAAPSGFEAFTERARILLRAADTRRTRGAIVGAQEATVFSGAISEHYRRRADRFRPWLDHEDLLLAELARQAIADMEKAARHQAERETLEDEGY
jgi:metal-responsive CopG/Arc/MetJ family transcriptional regulator